MEEETNSPDELENTEAEKRGVAGPAFLTLIILAIIGGLVYLPFYAEQDPTMKDILASKEWWVSNVGEYHPLILHLPIGIIFLTVTMEVFGWLSFGKYKPKTGLGLFLAFITGVFACVTGLFDLNADGLVAEEWKDDMYKHMWMGIIFVGVVGLAFLAKVWAKPGGGRGPVYAILLFGAAGAMGYGSHFGGLQTHGGDPIANTIEGLGLLPVDKESSEDGDDTVEDQAPVTKLPKDRLAFAEVVVPIMDNKCLYCHSEEAGKKKGKLYMDTYANLLIGGSSQDGDEYRTLVPGDSKKSYMIEVMNLPKDDDMHMPPPKKDQMEAHEIAILTWWVNSIPASDTLEDKTLEEMGAPQEILDAAAKLVSPEERKAMEAALEAEKNKAEQDRVSQREALQNSLDLLKQEAAFKTALKYVSKESSDLEFTSVSLRASLDDETFSKLSAVSEAMTSLDVSASSVTEGALATELPKMPNLKRLNLSQTEVGDGLLEAVSGIEGLEYLNLYGTKVTDAGVMQLKTLGSLSQLFVWDSKVTEDGAKALKKELPGLYINLGAKELR